MIRRLEISLLLACATFFLVLAARAQQGSSTVGARTAVADEEATGSIEVHTGIEVAGQSTEVRTESLRLDPSEVPIEMCARPTYLVGSLSASGCLLGSVALLEESPAMSGIMPLPDSKIPTSGERLRGFKPTDFDRGIYYKNKLEFTLDVGWLPINIPFPLDGLLGDPYNTYPLKYTLVPVIASLRWQLDNIGGPLILRGNWDATFSGSVTAIPRGPETRYFSYDMGVRRNFVPRNWRIAPYFDLRFGVGNIDAKGPFGVEYAQGQDLTFTMNAGSGVRYNFNSRYAISLGLNIMHISNANLSQSNGKPNWGVRNYGINVYGPMVGINIRLGKPKRVSAQ